MHFSGYCLKFKLNATHSILIDKIRSNQHAHNWEISLYLNKSDDSFIEFYELEKIIEDRLEYFQLKNLNLLNEFNNIEPTLENIGDVLHAYLNDVVISYNCNIYKMEISETPLRTYVIKQDLSKGNSNNYSTNKANPLLIRHIVQNVTEMVSNTENSSSFFKSKDNNTSNNKNEIISPECINEIKTNENTKPDISNVKDRKYYIKIFIKILGALAFGLMAAFFLLLYVNRNGQSPWGSDAFGHLFKADLLYDSIKKGDYFPLYTRLWYNGIQPFRYWAPLPYYFIAFFEFLSKGNIIIAYNIFIAFSFFFGLLGWVLWGLKEKRIFLSLSLGVLWFCLPDNLRVFFSEGNIPRAFVAIFLPYLLFFIWSFIEYRKKYALIISVFFMILIIFCHIMIAAMLGITLFIYLVYYGIANKKLGPSVQILIALVLSFALCGFWLYPALQGGLMSLDSEAVSSVMKSLTFPFTQSLNPSLRYRNIEIFYFGISVIFVALAGIILSKRKSIPGFLTVITIFIGTTTALVPVLIKLPLNQLLWMMRFTPVVYGIFLLSIITWKKLKRYAVIILVIIVAADSFASFKLLAFNTSPNPEIVNFLNDAIVNTNQRIAVLDTSEFGSFPSYYLTNSTNKTAYAYGWAWQGAKTAQNIVLINTALENEYYVFMFDRCLELGCDTIIIKKDKVKDFDNLISSASRNNYVFIKEYNIAYLFKRQTPKQFGMTTRYYGLAVGKSAPNISLEFPGFEIGNTYYIDEYDINELLKYKVIYMSDFLYHDKNKAQELVLSASEKGVKFVIDMNRVPNDPINNRLTFLDVTAQPIQFEKQLPDLYYQNITYVPTTFKKEFRNWNTVYLENVDNPRGFSWFYGNKLVFIGTSKNSNITFIGFNMLYHGIVNDDSNTIGIFESEMGILKNTLPERSIEELKIDYTKNTIKISGTKNDINTTLANLDSFDIDGQSYTKHNLLFMKDSSITIRMTYPYLKQGLIVTFTGLFLLLLLIIFMYIRRSQNEE